ncbi:MAG: hypothetical protein ACLFV3_00515 [Phycisphaeraceae bacterium]
MHHRSTCALTAFAAAAIFAAPAVGSPLVNEDFSSDPLSNPGVTLTGSGDRFTYDATAQALTAHYESNSPTAKLAWALPKHLTDQDAFRFEADLTIRSAGFFASPNASAQIAFGLVNSETTGTDRPGGVAGDAWDIATVDYFPNDSPYYHTQSAAPSVIASEGTAGDYYDHLHTDYTTEAQIDGAGETGLLPMDEQLFVSVDYDPATRFVTLRIENSQGGLPINLDGLTDAGYDDDPATTQIVLPESAAFDVDSFALTLWEDTFGGDYETGESATVADVSFHRFAVSAVPEPASAGLLLGLAIAGGLVRPRRRTS